MRRNVAIVAAAIAVACGRGPSVVSEGRAGSYESALAVIDAGGSDGTRPTPSLVAGWYDTRYGTGDIYLRTLDERGRPDGPERRLTSTPEESYEVSLDAAGDILAVAWYDKAIDDVLTAQLGVWDAGQIRSDPPKRWLHSLGSGTRNPVVRTRGGRVFCAWIARDGDGESVWAGWWDAAGAAIGAPLRIGPASQTTWNLNAAIDRSGGGWVVYDAMAGTRSDELFLGHVTGGGASIERLSDDDGVSSKYPDIAIDGDRVAMTWFDTRDGNSEVYLGVGRLDAATALTVRRVTATAGESIGAYLAWNAGRIGLAWSDNTVGQHEVYFQGFDASAVALGEPRRVTWTSASSLVPAIRPWGDGFALAWNEYTPPPDGLHGHGGRSVIATAIVR